MKTCMRTVALAAAIVLAASTAFAHCDALDGPVVKAAIAALDKADVVPVLRWITPGQETEVRAAFRDAVTVRAAGGPARTLADRYFIETLVRLHRQSEGEPYTGLKPAGTASEQLIAADRALEGGGIDRLADALSRATASSLRAKFAEAVELRARADESVEAGRRYIAAYVAFIHYVEGIGGLSAKGPHAHGGGRQ